MRDSAIVSITWARLGGYFLPDQPLHVIERGNNRGAIFLGADNYARYRDWLVEAAGSYGCAIHAYVLTTNHVHLLVTPRVGRDRPGRVRRAASWSLDMLGRSRTGRAAPLRRATRHDEASRHSWPLRSTKATTTATFLIERGVSRSVSRMNSANAICCSRQIRCRGLR